MITPVWPPPVLTTAPPPFTVRVVHAGQHVHVEVTPRIGVLRGDVVLDWDAFLPMSSTPLTDFDGGLYEAIWSAVTQHHAARTVLAA